MTIPILLLILAGPICGRLTAQPTQAETDAIVAEGTEMFYLELASWQATDLALAEIAELGSDAYFAYRDGDSLRTIYYLTANPGVVVGEVAFDSQANIASQRLQWRARPSTLYEQSLMRMRASLVATCVSNKKSHFLTYDNTGINIVLLPGARPVAYMLTAPMEPGVLLIGNDYKFEFDGAGKVTRYKRLHEDLRSIPTTEDTEVSAHAHEKGESPYMTSTDICTLLLYGQNTTWDQHLAVHPKYVSFWNLEKRTLVVITSKAWDRIVAHQNSKK